MAESSKSKYFDVGDRYRRKKTTTVVYGDPKIERGRGAYLLSILTGAFDSNVQKGIYVLFLRILFE